MKVLLVHPSPLMYSEIYLRLEPLGLELVAQAVRRAGHTVRVLDLQIFTHADYFDEVRRFQPDAVGFSLNYLANVPEVIGLAMQTKQLSSAPYVFVGGHSASFIAQDVLAHARGAIDCLVRGEGEAITPRLLAEISQGGLERLPGVVTPAGTGPQPQLIDNLDELQPARDLARKRRRYFIGELDPCASIEFTRGCPWDCSFCSAWTFYGRSYRKLSPEVAADSLARIQEPNVFIVDDVAFIFPEDGFAIGQAIEKQNIRKQYYLETRPDILLRNQEVFAYWKRLGLKYMFLGIEALDEEGLKLHRKRINPNKNFEALEVARKLGITVAINIIADPDWDEKQFEVIREWATSVPEIVHLTVNTPYPGTETWFTELRKLETLDYRLFDVQHAVLPTRLPLRNFYEELVKTQSILNRKHLGFAALKYTFTRVTGLLLQGQTNFLRMLWKFSRIYNPERQYQDHLKSVCYHMTPPRGHIAKPSREQLYVITPSRRRSVAPPEHQEVAP